MRTGCREDGSNGYVWCACTPQRRYYEYQQSHGGDVVKARLREHFEGVLGSDFLASYTIHAGLHRRMPGRICYATATSGSEQYPDDAEVQQWAKDVKAVYERATASAGPDPSLPPAKQGAARRTQQHAFEQELWQLCALYAHMSSPLHTLCERVERFLPELFIFVARPEIPAHNNLAERSVRPLVIARNVSGARAAPTVPRHAWRSSVSLAPGLRRRLNSFFHCLAVLAQSNPLG